MTNDLNFLNNYVEIVNDNVSSIIKQNFVFQTQLKMAETKLAQLEDSKQTVDKLTIENKSLQQQITDFNNLTSSYKHVADDKSRLQVSLNETSQIKNQLQADLNAAEQELIRLRNQVAEIEVLRKENETYKKKLGLKEETPIKEKPTKEKPVELSANLKATSGTF
jgi:chromosome segregation ATPase